MAPKIVKASNYAKPLRKTERSTRQKTITENKRKAALTGKKAEHQTRRGRRNTQITRTRQRIRKQNEGKDKALVDQLIASEIEKIKADPN
jgi:hypothetical protein